METTSKSALHVRTTLQSLPGRAVSAAALVNGTLWLILDPAKVGRAAGAASQLVVSVLGGGN